MKETLQGILIVIICAWLWHMWVSDPQYRKNGFPMWDDLSSNALAQ
jgi:hypothetical protein